MTSIYNEIVQAKSVNKKLLAILLDPDKIVWNTLDSLISKINQSPATHIFLLEASFILLFWMI
jgi:putative glycerol-1-phosphate prenyltransferase